MNIGLDARSLTAPRPRGTGRNLLDAYRLIPGLRPQWQFTLFHQRPIAQDRTDHGRRPWDHPNVTLTRLDMPGDRLDAWFQVRMPLAARRARIELLHCPANAAPCWCPVPVVVTIHDLIPLKLRGELNPRQTRRFVRGVSRAARRAAHIITPSEATRDDLHADFRVPREKMTVIPWAADTRVLNEGDIAPNSAVEGALRSKYGLTARWLLSFSGSTRRKNARGILDGFARVPLETRRHVQIVLVGCEPADYRDDLNAQAERLGIANQCRVLGFVPHEDLPALLRGSAGLLMPSMYEGFGLPILDAFASGVPVVTSSVSSMPEVAGSAAVYCHPNDPLSIAEGIASILDSNTAGELVRLGYLRLAEFSWERTAAAMCGVYERCLSDRRLTPRAVVRVATEGVQ